MQVAKAGANGAGGRAGPPPDRLRRIRWILAGVLVAGAGLLAGTYFLQPQTADLKVPRVSLRVRETAHGFVLTRSEGERMIFRLKAALATQMQHREHTILRQVDLVVFDRDGVHADRISGEQFQYDPASGNVVAVGEVHIALEGQRAGAAEAEDNTTAGSSRGSPIEVTAQRLWFNTKTGLAVAGGGLDFRYWNAVGHADAARVEAGSNRLVMSGNVLLRWAPPGRWPLEVRAGKAILDKAARTITLVGGGEGGAAGAAVVTMGPRRLTAPRLVLTLGPDDVVRAAMADGGVQAQGRENGRQMQVSCQTAKLWFQLPRMNTGRGPLRQPEARLEKMMLSGNVVAEATQADGRAARAPFSGGSRQAVRFGSRRRQMPAGEGFSAAPRRERLQAAVVTVDFAGGNEPTQAEAEQAMVWMEGGAGMRGRGDEPRLEVQAPALRFIFGPGARAGQTVLRQAITEGRGTVRYTPVAGGGPVRMTANQFTVKWNRGQRIEEGRAMGEVAWNQAAAGKQEARRGTAGAVTAWTNQKTGQVARLVASGGVTLAVAGMEGSTGPRGRADGGTAVEPGPWDLGAGGGIAMAGDRLTWDAGKGVAQLTPRNGARVTATSANGRLEAAQLTLTPVEMIASGGVSVAWTGGEQRAESKEQRAEGKEARAEGKEARARTEEVQAEGRGSGAEGRKGEGVAGLLGPDLTGGSGPVNLTAATLTVSRDGQRGVFVGGVRVWRGSSVLQAATLRFNRAQGTVTANGPGATGVRTTFLSPRGGRLAAGQTRLAGLAVSGGAAQRRPQGRTTAAPQPVAVVVTAPELRYWRRQELAEYSGGVRAKAAETRLTCQYLKIEWAGRSGRPARLVAGGGVEVRQPGRRAQGQTAVYDARQGVVRLRGGSPSIYDAELGMLAGSALTFSPVNDTIRVESGPHTRTFAAYQVSH